jgi:hypothetical protein
MIFKWHILALKIIHVLPLERKAHNGGQIEHKLAHQHFLLRDSHPWMYI